MSSIAVIDKERLVFAKRLAHAARTGGARALSRIEANMKDGLVTVSGKVGATPVVVEFYLPQRAWGNPLRRHLINLFSASAAIAMRNCGGNQHESARY